MHIDLFFLVHAYVVSVHALFSPQKLTALVKQPAGLDAYVFSVHAWTPQALHRCYEIQGQRQTVVPASSKTFPEALCTPQFLKGA